MMVELGVVEQRYQAVLALIEDGQTVTEVARPVAGVPADGACVAGQV
jgi:hypothetical protein